ncbi:IS200/IS605 family transposase [Desulfonema limicola]|uniref:IS200/IS605 family transposase n=1 Tax=Desulfonema limicola TaxID=45656 RepID=UPI001A9B10DE
MRTYRKSSHCIHDLKVHLIWITKYRYKVLTKDVGFRIRDLIRQDCDSNDLQIISGRVSKDHIHLYVSYPPKISVSNMVKKLKDWLKLSFNEKLTRKEKLNETSLQTH